jgi:cobalt-zinc-cadmium efflux system outer membrane protein
MQMGPAVQATRPPVASPLPEIGAPKAVSGPIYRLADLEAKALSQNPGIAAADAGVHSAEGRKQQAGLWPNPTVGYFGDEISGGAGVNGGRQGGFIEQTIVLGRKLYLAQQVAASEVKISELAKEEQRYRVQNAVRAEYFRILAAQEMLSLASARVDLASKTLDASRQLQNTGARDASEVVMAEVELERAKLGADIQNSQLRQQWEVLRSIVGDASLPMGRLAGKLDADLPQLDTQQLTNALLNDSPAVKITREEVSRAQSSALQTQRRSIPDVTVRAGLEQNFETNDLTGKPYGLQGVAEARIGLPLFDRNQGNVAAGRAELQRSEAEGRRIELQLRQEAAAVVEGYETARLTAAHYHGAILPRMEQLYEMQQNAWARMALSYPQLLLAQQSLFSAQAEYIQALENLRTNAVALSGFLLADGLRSSAQAPGGVQ